MTKTKAKSNMQRFAEYYAHPMGLRVFPCNGKIPITDHGCKDATTDAEQIERWWGGSICPNVAIATGNGIVVLDVDIDHDAGKFGDETLEGLEDQYGKLPDTWMCLTGGGGIHYYFKSDDPALTVGTSFAPGLDYRGAGGYVIAPPSRHQNGRTYEWEASHTPTNVDLAPLPEWLHRLMLQGKSKDKPTQAKTTTDAPEMVTEGKRNEEMFKLASSLRSKGFTVEEITATMMKANKTRCNPPLDTKEIETICKSAGRYERGHHEQTEDKPIRQKKPYLTEEILEDYLVKNDMSVRLNIITHDIEVEGIPDTYNPETRRQDLPVILYDDLKINYRCDRQSIVDLLSLIAGRNRYNPVLELIDRGEWDKHDYFGDLVEILGIHKEDNLSQTLLYKWIVQCYQMLKNDINHAYGADGMLVLQGPQGIGKTSFVRVIGIRPDFVKLGQYLDTKDKDTLRRCTSAWIVELGEIETTLKSDIERLKAFITAEKDEYRLPYGRADQTIARRTSLIGTCNSERFLIDPTGSRRFWTIPVDNIDLNQLMEFDSLQLWRQVKVMCADCPNDFRLTKEERRQLEARNCQHEKPLKSQEEIEDIFDDAARDPGGFEWRYTTVSEFKEEYASLRHYDVSQIGRALDKLGIMVERPRINGKKTKVRRLPCHKWGRMEIPVTTQKNDVLLS